MAENKERLVSALEQSPKIETAVMVDIQERNEKMPREIETWMDKIEKNSQNLPTINDQSGQPILKPVAPQQPVIVLPISRSKFVAGFKQTIVEAQRWLSTFVLRLIKMKKGKVKFKEE